LQRTRTPAPSTMKATGAVASRKTPPTASHTFLSTMSKIETNLRSLSGSRPRHRSQARNTVKLSELRRAQLSPHIGAHCWWS